MILYFLRHAHAEDGMNKPDELRALSAKGHEQAESLAALVKRIRLEADVVFTSPRLRSTQTAEAIASVMGIQPEIREELNFGFNLPLLSTLLGDIGPKSAVVLVGHEPTMSQTIQAITGARVEMKKCGFARVDVLVRQPLQGELVWLLTPKLVRSLNGD